MDFAVIRGGMGTISDCVAARLPMLYVNDPKPEIQFNQQRLEQLGIGLPLERISKQSSDLLTNPGVIRQMVGNMAGLDLNGEIEAARILANLWRSKAKPVAEKSIR